MMQLFGQMMWMPFSMLTGWMNVLASAMRCMQPAGSYGPMSGQDFSYRYGNAPGMVPGTGSYRDNQWAQGAGATQAKEERDMSDCGCCDKNHREVKLVEYTIVSIKRCDERIITKGEVIYSDDMSDESFATWVIALYLQEPDHEPIHHDDKKYLRVYHHVLESWPRPEKDCCDDDRQVSALRDIERAIREWGGPRREEAAARA
jgi:hypothetical protein